MSTGFVYLMKDSKGRHKIGFSRQPKGRVGSVKCMENDLKIEIVHLIKTDSMVELERLLHDRYCLFRDEGEWFHLDNQAVQEICSIDRHVFYSENDLPSNDTGYAKQTFCLPGPLVEAFQKYVDGLSPKASKTNAMIYILSQGLTELGFPPSRAS